MHNTNTYTQQKQAPAVGYWHSLPLTAALKQMGNSHSSSAVSHIPTPASLQTPRLASQLKGSAASEPRSQIPPPQCQCHLSRKNWGMFGVESKETERSRLLNAVLGKIWPHLFWTQGMSGSSVDNLAVTECCRVHSDLINRRKKTLTSHHQKQ